MSLDTRRAPIGSRRAVAFSTLAFVLIAAASSNEAGFERLRGLPAAERSRLLENLRKFDLVLSPEQQSAARDLDRRLADLSPVERANYLAVLRRYHTWVNGLPEPRQDELASRPAGERMALVRKLIADRPVPAGDTPPLLRVLEAGEYSPFEVASAYKIWQALSEKERADVEKMPTEHARREALFRIGARPKHAIPRETLRDDFDEEKWDGQVKTLWPGIRALTPAEERPKAKMTEALKKRIEALLPEIARRRAINLYVNRAKIDPVDPERLSRFMAALPRGVQESFDALPPDEARRRMAFAYRLVFPRPEEIGASRKAAETAGKERPRPSPRKRTTPGPAPKAGGDATPSPF